MPLNTDVYPTAIDLSTDKFTEKECTLLIYILGYFSSKYPFDQAPEMWDLVNVGLMEKIIRMSERAH
jgi:hypothetical protein